MAELISWALTLGAKGSSPVKDGRSISVDAVVSASFTLEPAMAAPIELDLQLSDAETIDVLLVTASSYDSKLEISGDSSIKLAGPLLLFGGAAKLLGATLDTLKVQNSHPTETIELRVVCGRALVPPA